MEIFIGQGLTMYFRSKEFNKQPLPSQIELNFAPFLTVGIRQIFESKTFFVFQDLFCFVYPVHVPDGWTVSGLRSSQAWTVLAAHFVVPNWHGVGRGLRANITIQMKWLGHEINSIWVRSLQDQPKLQC